MRFRKSGLLAMIAFFALSGTGFSESEISRQFTEAYEKNNAFAMSAVIRQNKDKVQAEIKSLLDNMKPGMTREERDGKYYLAELMAKTYADITGNPEPLRDVKKRAFTSKLSAAVRSTTVEMGKPTEAMKNYFKPDNIIAKKGDTVKFVNNDDVAHIFATMQFLGNSGIFTPKIEPGQSWSYKFEKPGEYYYLCFIHQSMIGKVTVEDNGSTPAPADSDSAPAPAPKVEPIPAAPAPATTPAPTPVAAPPATPAPAPAAAPAPASEVPASVTSPPAQPAVTVPAPAPAPSGNTAPAEQPQKGWFKSLFGN